MNTREGWDERRKAGRGDCRGKGEGDFPGGKEGFSELEDPLI